MDSVKYRGPDAPPSARTLHFYLQQCKVEENHCMSNLIMGYSYFALCIGVN